jgi:hypothetical protein
MFVTAEDSPDAGAFKQWHNLIDHRTGIEMARARTVRRVVRKRDAPDGPILHSVRFGK